MRIKDENKNLGFTNKFYTNSFGLFGFHKLLKDEKKKICMNMKKEN